MDNVNQFISEYEIPEELRGISKSSIDDLQAIAEDYKARVSELKISAEYFANALQAIPCVHSVRWRTKDVKHLIRKIVRKKAENSEKYISINKENYQIVVNDLIGIRAIHLFKDDLIEIDKEVRLKWQIRETPTIYIREGDENCPNVEQPYEQKVHKAGYRSAHYIIESNPTKETVTAELQVRTIFEEGWSEIDHTLRYPDHSDDRDLHSVLTLFNRIAGSADEIASFTLRLRQSLESTKSTLAAYKTESTQYKHERDASYEKIDNLLQELNKHKTKDAEKQQLLERLREEMSAMREKESNLVPLSTDYLSPTKNHNNKNSDAGKLLAAIAALALLTSK